MRNDEQRNETKPNFIVIRKLINELLRVSPLLGLIVPFLFLDDSWHMVLFVTALLAFALLSMHIVRKTMYPYIDIEELVNKAKENPIASAITLFGFFMFLSSILFVYALLLR